MIFGESSLSFYKVLRDSLRVEFIPVAVVLFAVLVLACFIVFLKRNRVKEIYANKTIKLALFFLAFSFISLIPFLGLGNISQRYSYVASIGFALLIALILKVILSKIKNQRNGQFLIIFITLILGIFYLYQVNMSNLEWRETGRITNRALAYIRLYNDGQHPNSNFYFVNPPIRKANAWIFPVGLDDGLWFIYRDDSIKVYKITSIDEGRTILKNASEPDKNFVFAFDKNGNIYEIK